MPISLRLSLRPHLIAGTVATVVSAIVAMPVNPAQQTLPEWKVVSDMRVALVGFDNPFDQVIATAQQGQGYVFANYYNGGDVPTPGAGEANWPFAGFDQTGGDLLNYLLYNQVSLGYYNSVGLLPQLTIDSQPIITQLSVNWSDYLNHALTGVTSAAFALSSGVWNFPSAVIAAAQFALGGDISAALTELGDAILTPIAAAGTALLDAGTYVLSNAVAKFTAVIAALPQVTKAFAGAIVGGAALTVHKSVEITNAVIGDLTTLNIEGAWNAAVGGLLGPSGLPGLALNLTVGAGVQTGTIQDPATDIPTNFVPSVRTAVQAAQWGITEALTATPPSAAVVPTARSVRSAAASRSSRVSVLKSVSGHRVKRSVAAHATN